MFKPKKTKFKKISKLHIPRRLENSNFSSKLIFGMYGLKAISPGIISNLHMSSINHLLKQKIKKNGFIIYRVFPLFPVTKQRAGSRMGSGKGLPVKYSFPVKPGRIILEIRDVKSSFIVWKALKSISYCLPFKTKIIIIKDDSGFNNNSCYG